LFAACGRGARAFAQNRAAAQQCSLTLTFALPLFAVSGARPARSHGCIRSAVPGEDKCAARMRSCAIGAASASRIALSPRSRR
jgi:hypothetical protein